MDFDVIGAAGPDVARRKRLLLGYGIGTLLCGASLAAAVNVSAGQAPPPEEEAPVDVTLATKAEEKPPEPPPPSDSRTTCPVHPVAAKRRLPRRSVTRVAGDDEDAPREGARREPAPGRGALWEGTLREEARAVVI